MRALGYNKNTPDATTLNECPQRYYTRKIESNNRIGTIETANELSEYGHLARPRNRRTRVASTRPVITVDDCSNILAIALL